MSAENNGDGRNLVKFSFGNGEKNDALEFKDDGAKFNQFKHNQYVASYSNPAIEKNLGLKAHSMSPTIQLMSIRTTIQRNRNKKQLN